MTFEAFCKSRRVELLPHQREFAEAFISDERIRRFMRGPIGSGRTLTLTLLEHYFEWIARNPGTEPTL